MVINHIHVQYNNIKHKWIKWTNLRIVPVVDGNPPVCNVAKKSWVNLSNVLTLGFLRTIDVNGSLGVTNSKCIKWAYKAISFARKSRNGLTIVISWYRSSKNDYNKLKKTFY